RGGMASIPLPASEVAVEDRTAGPRKGRVRFEYRARSGCGSGRRSAGTTSLAGGIVLGVGGGELDRKRRGTFPRPPGSGRVTVTPEQMIARIEASIDATPVSEFDDVHATTQERIFQLLSEQPMVADVRAGLFRVLSTIQGVSVEQDAIDAAGRHGTASVYTGASGTPLRS
ncbi:hypothetical protein, partial [Nonomuraea sp. NPDC003201]